MSTVRRTFIVAVVFAVVAGCSPQPPDEPNVSSSPPAESGPPCERWLRGILLEIGAPEGLHVEPSDLTNVVGHSSSIRLEVPAYEGRYEVSTFAEEPDFVNVDVESIPAIDRIEDFVLHGNRVAGDTQQFLLEGNDVWVTMHVVPETEDINRGAVRECLGM